MTAVDVARRQGWLSPRLARSGGGTDVRTQIEPESRGARRLAAVPALIVLLRRQPGLCCW